MKYCISDQSTLPLLIESGIRDAARDAEQFLAGCLVERTMLRAKLLENGALLLRGFPALDVPQFARFSRDFAGRELLDYVAGASPRIKLGDGVYTSTEYPGSFSLSLHNELSYTSSWPEYLFFCCVTPSAAGGETTLGDSRTILRKLDADVVQRFQSKKIRYDRLLDDDAASNYSWQAAFKTRDRAAVEKYCSGDGMRFDWNADGSLSLSEVRPATAVHPATGEEVWFNQADGFHPSVMGGELYAQYLSSPEKERVRLNALFGDGTEIDVADLEHIRDTIRKDISLVRWRAGDILIVENMLACHGRMPFTGTRKIILAMA